MYIKKSLFGLIAIVSTSICAVSVDHMSSLVAAPGLHDTIVVRGPLVIGIVKDSGKNPMKNKSVAIYIDKRKVAVVPTNKYGVWSYLLNPSQYLQNSAHMVEACVTVGPNNIVWTQATLFYVNATRNTQGHRSGNVNVGNSAVNFPSDQSYINISTPTVIGTLLDSNNNPVMNETIRIKISGVTVGTVTSDSNGVFSYQLNNALSDGSYTVGAHCVQSNVNLATNSFVVLTTPPDAPVIVDPAQSSTQTSSTVIVSGTTASSATVTTFMDGDTFGVIGYADENGNWSIEYDDLANGSHSVIAQATDLANNTGAISTATDFNVSA